MSQLMNQPTDFIKARFLQVRRRELERKIAQPDFWNDIARAERVCDEYFHIRQWLINKGFERPIGQ